MKQIIRLTENDLHNLVKESVKKIIKEIGNTPAGRNKIRQAIANKREKMEAEPGVTDAWKKHRDTKINVEKGLRNKYKDFYSEKGPGVKNLGVGRYNTLYTSDPDDLAYELFDDALAEKFIEWSREVNFDPTWYGYSREISEPDVNYYGVDYDSDINADDAFEYELDKIDDCPFLSPEQKEKYKDTMRSKVEESDPQDNYEFEPYEPEPPYEYGLGRDF